MTAVETTLNENGDRNRANTVYLWVLSGEICCFEKKYRNVEKKARVLDYDAIACAYLHITLYRYSFPQPRTCMYEYYVVVEVVYSAHSF